MGRRLRINHQIKEPARHGERARRVWRACPPVAGDKSPLVPNQTWLYTQLDNFDSDLVWRVRMSRENLSLFLVLLMSMVVPRAQVDASERRNCRAIVKMEGIPSNLVQKVQGKVYSFEADALSGDSEWPLSKRNGVISANISLPSDSDYSESPLNIQTAFMAETNQGKFKCTGEVNVMRTSEDNSPIVLHSTCEEAI